MSGSGFTDWQDVGIFPLQDHEAGVPIEIRQQLVAGRIARMRDPGGSDPQDSLLEVAREKGKGTLGDIHPWWFWQTEDRDIRGMGSWAQSFAALSVGGGTGGFKGGRTGVPVSPSELLPIANGAFRSDSRYVNKFPGWPACFPSVPQGTVMLAIPATTEGIQTDLMLHADPRLVCPNIEGPAESGTLVVDLQPEGAMCMDKSATPGVGGRHARLQSFLRVIAQKKGDTLLGPGNVLAWNLALSGVDRLAGYGLCFTRLQPGLQSNKTRVPPTKTNNKKTRSKKPHDAGPGDGPCEFGKFEPKKNDAHGLAFMAHDITYGPFTGGGEGDKHKFGEDADGHEINSGHIHVDGYFYRNQVEDGPLYFEGQYPRAKAGPLKQQVHLGWDGTLGHAWTFGQRQGKWRWWADVPYYVPTTPRDLDPPYKKPKQPKTPSGDVPPSVPRDLDPPNTGDPVPPADPPGRVQPPLTNPRIGPNPPDGNRPVPPRGGVPVSGPITPRGPLDPVDPGVPPDTVDDDWPSDTVCRVGSLDQGHRSLFTIHHPTSESFAEIPIRPQLMVSGAAAYLHCNQFDVTQFEQDECGTPQVLVMRSWGATTAEGAWEYLDGEGPFASRARGGVAKGGILLTPPAHEIEDYLLSTGANVETTSRNAYFAMAPGVCFAFGLPNSDGGLNAKGLVAFQDASNGNHAFTMNVLNSSRVEVQMFGFEFDQTNAEGVVDLASAPSAGMVRIPRQAAPPTTSTGTFVKAGGEMYVDTTGGTDQLTYYDFAGGVWRTVWSSATASDVNTFVGLTDTPGAMGSSNQLATVNGAGGALQWVDSIDQFTGSSSQGNFVRLNGDGKIDSDFVDTFVNQNALVLMTTASVSANTTLDDTYHVVLVDATSAAITITLPAASSSAGVTYTIKKIDATANTVTIDGNAAETIDDATTAVIVWQYEAVTIVCDGTEWWVL